MPASVLGPDVSLGSVARVTRQEKPDKEGKLTC